MSLWGSSVPIEDASADVRATFFNTEKYDVDSAAPYFEEITIKLDVTSPAPREAVGRLVNHAERACHAAQSFRRPIPVTLGARLNGAELAVAASEPAAESTWPDS